MLAIFMYDLKKELKSVRMAIVSFIFIILSFLIAKYSQSLEMFIDGKSPAIDTLFAIYAIIVFLFSSILFSNSITKSIQSQTIRYIIPYISRKKYYFSKFLVMITYFSVITILSLFFLLVIRKEFYLPIKSIFNLFIFYSYTESVILLISTISKTERSSYFIGMIVSLIMPILYAVAYFKNNIWLDVVNWLLPYKYLDSNREIIFLILITGIIFFLGMYSFERKEL